MARLLKNGQGSIESQKFKVITNFLNHETLELYGIVLLHRSSFMGARGLRLLTGGP